MFTYLSEMLSFTFMVRALIVGALVSLCSALLGVSLVLKRYSMIGDGLSHVCFGAMAVAVALGIAPLKVAIPSAVLAAFLLLRVGESSRIKGDSAVALISTGAMAVGIMVVSMVKGINTDITNFMFGSVLAMTKEDVLLSVLLCGVVLLVFVLFYKYIFSVTFDENFARATGIKAGAYNMLLAALAAVTVVLGMRMIGALLISSLILFPPLTAMRLAKDFKGVVICSGVVALVCFFVGLTVSYAKSTPAGASVVVANILCFVLFSIVEQVQKRI